MNFINFFRGTLIVNYTALDDDDDDLREGTYHLSDGIKA